MLKNNKHQLLVAGTIIAFCFGFLIGSLVNEYFIDGGFSLSHEVHIEVDIIGLLTLLVTVILVFLVSRVLSTKDSQEKLEKENLIEYFQSFANDFVSKMKQIAQNEEKLVYVTGILRRYRMRSQKLFSLGKKHKLINTDSLAMERLDAHIKEIIDLMTDTPKKGEVTNGVTAKEGKLYFSEKQIDLIVATVYDVNSDVFDIIVEINRCSR